MIFSRCLALRIYTEKIHDHQDQLVYKRDGMLVYSFGQASFAVVLSFGTVIFWNVPLVKQKQFIEQIQPFIKSSVRPEITESFTLNIGQSDQITFDEISLTALTLPDVIALSFVLAQSVALTRMEETVDEELYQLNRILRPIEKSGRITKGRKLILQKIGFILRDRTHSFYEYGFQQTPPETWKNDRTEGLYEELKHVLEVKQRIQIVNEKWNTVTDTMQFVLGAMSEQKGFRLDIALLIAAVLADACFTFWQVISK